MKILNYRCHRKFLFDYIDANSLSLREFVRLVEDVTSISALSHFFKKDKSGQFVGSYCFRTDTWLEILSYLKLTQTEFDHLFLLKIQDDVIGKFHDGSAQASSIRRIIKQMVRQTSAEANIGISIPKLSRKGASIGKVYDALPEALQMELQSETERLSDYFLVGQKRSSRIAGLTTHLEALRG